MGSWLEIVKEGHSRAEIRAGRGNTLGEIAVQADLFGKLVLGSKPRFKEGRRPLNRRGAPFEEEHGAQPL